MGPFREQKKQIIRDIKHQRNALCKARKLAIALLGQLDGVEGRLDQTEHVLESFPGGAIDNTLQLIKKGEDQSVIMAQLQQLMKNVTKNLVRKHSRSTKIIRKTVSKTAPVVKISLPRKIASSLKSRPSIYPKSSLKNGLSKAATSKHSAAGNNRSLSSASRKSMVTPPAPPNSRQGDDMEDEQ